MCAQTHITNELIVLQAAICVLTFNLPLIAGTLLEVVYPPSQDFTSFLNMTFTQISDHTVADFTPPDDPIASI